jgi:hypothetical protein
MKVDAQGFAELKRLLGKMPVPLMGLTDKNKRFLRQFDDPAVLRRLYRLPDQLWAEVRRDPHANFRTLAKAQVALGTAILSYMPLRPQNLTALAFGTHLFVQEGTGISSRRAARHHYRLVQEALESQMPVRRRKKRAS